MQRTENIVKGIAIYQILFGLLGIVFFFLSINSAGFEIVALLVFVYPTVSGLMLFIKKIKVVGLVCSIINYAAQSFLFIIGSVWYQYYTGFSIGFVINKFTRNVWQGKSTTLLLNVGSKYTLMFNDQNTQFSLGINLFAIIIAIFLTTYLIRIVKDNQKNLIYREQKLKSE